jgi:outer membrane protein OmpA-like peptidoglycan-associated protein
MSPRIAWLFAALLVVAAPAQAQFGDLLNRASKQAADAAAKAAKDAAKPAPEQPAPKEPASAPAAAKSDGAQPATAAPAGAAASPPAAEAFGNRYDFIPGDKVLVFDDFSDTDVGEYPAKWTIKGGGGNSLEVVQIGDRRFLKSRYQVKDQSWAQTWLRYEIKGDMPKNFTIEFDMDLGGPLGVMFSKWHGYGGQMVKIHASEGTQVTSSNANGKLSVKSGIQHVAIAVSGTQVKVYVAGERVLSDPDGVVRPITRLGVEFHQPYPREDGDHQMLTNLRIAEGGKPAKQMLAGEGRIVTHGILFDTGSDVIKPESGPTLRSILALLNEDPGLKFAIEGHTDDQGGPKVNGPLSERRAAAVKAWLVNQGIDASRLTSKGLGQSKSIDTNDTAEGRANNRRVEFVRIGGK